MVRPANPLGPIGLVLPTFVQDTMPLWSAGPVLTESPAVEPLTEVAAVCRDAEALGADALWACDHLFWHGPCLECMVVLAVAATATERAILGTCVVQLPLRQATAVAKQAATLQTLTQGRVILGVGVGSHVGEYDQAGIDYHARGRLLDAGIAELRRSWSSGHGVTQREHGCRGHRPAALPSVARAAAGTGMGRRFFRGGIAKGGHPRRRMDAPLLEPLGLRAGHRASGQGGRSGRAGRRTR